MQKKTKAKVCQHCKHIVDKNTSIQCMHTGGKECHLSI